MGPAPNPASITSPAHTPRPPAVASLPQPRHDPLPLRLTRTLFLAATVLLLAVYFLHLSADFPHNSPWSDWAKYTDEGWYGDAAIRHFELGHWYLPGDFNPAAALPVWPLLEALLFQLTGVSLIAARALSVATFAGILLASYHLLRRAPSRLAPAAAVLLLASSPFCFAFMRLAILEPLLILLTLLALLAASGLHPRSPRFASRTAPALLVGLLLPLLVLTKTTGLFLTPAVFWLLFARCGYRPRLFLRPALLAAGTALALWSAWFLLAVRPHLLADFRYLFNANAYTGITLRTAPQVLFAALRDGLWTGPVTFLLALAAALATLALRPLRRDPLAISLLLWTAGYAAFLAYHDNLQPRYYTVIAVPLTLLLCLTLERLWTTRLWTVGLWTVPPWTTRLQTTRRTRTTTGRLPARAAVVAALAVLVVSTTRNATRTVRYATHPSYTYLAAARGIAGIIRQHPHHPRLLLSVSGADLSLMTGIPSICDDFGTMDLEDRIDLYKPGWYASWNQVDDDKMDALTPAYRVERVASFPAYDDPERNLLILYRLDPAATRSPRRHRPGKPLPRHLETRSGQQPSATQLNH